MFSQSWGLTVKKKRILPCLRSVRNAFLACRQTLRLASHGRETILMFLPCLLSAQVPSQSPHCYNLKQNPFFTKGPYLIIIDLRIGSVACISQSTGRDVAEGDDVVSPFL